MTNIKPWGNKKWHGGQIRPNGAGVLALLVTAVIFLTIGMIAVLNSENALKLPPNKENIALLFPFIGMCLLMFAVFLFLRNRKWRGSKFVMQTMPGVIGGRVSGVLIICGDLGRDTIIDVTLVNEQQRTNRSRKKTNTSTSYLFKHQIQVNSDQIQRTGSGYTLPGALAIEIPLDVEIPYEAKDETDNYKSGRNSYCYQWKLKVKADIPGMDLELQFVLPVYRTEASDPSINQAKFDTVDAAAAVAAHQAGKLHFNEIKTDTFGGSEHYISKGRWRALLVFGLIIFLVGIGVAWDTIVNVIPKFFGSDASTAQKLYSPMFLINPVMVSIGFLLFGSLLLALSVYLMGTKDVCVEGGQVNYVKRLGSKQWRQTIGRDYIVDIAVKSCGSSGHNKFYAVELSHSDLSQLNRLGQFFYKKAAEKQGFAIAKVTIEIARDIDNKAEAHLLAEKIKQQLGLEV